MNFIIHILGVPLGALMSICYSIFQNYGLAIILFTVMTKVILIPVSVWVHKNSIKMVKMQPEINFLKAEHYGDADYIADKQAAIFKRDQYNPFASILPLVIQIVLLTGLVEVIYNPLNYLLNLPEDLIDGLCTLTVGLTGADITSSSLQLLVVDAVKNPAYTQMFLNQFPDAGMVLSEIQNLNLTFFGFNLSWVPNQVRGITIAVPVVAGFSSWLLCVVQNAVNVLQSEQGRLNKYSTMALSVGLSLYLGWFVPAGVALYWMTSNTLAILQLFILNHIISPKKHVDYERLEESKQALAAIEALEPHRKAFQKDVNAKREREDYKRFFSIANKHLVFYSEKSGFYKYFQNVIEYLLAHSNVIIHYITNDPNDLIFELAQKQIRIKPYYIGSKKIITLMMKMDADMVVMTTPDLDNYYIKRSYTRKDVEYVYMFHGVTSTNMCIRKGAYDHFDTIFCVGQHQIDELRETEAMYQLPAKNLIPCGYGLLDNLLNAYAQQEKVNSNKKRILIAPSWQEGNILESCLEEVVSNLYPDNYFIVVRPHPEFVKRFPNKMEKLKEQFYDYSPEKFVIESDFSSNVTIFTADLLITDWSGIAYEFSYTTKKPVLLIDTPMKVLNEDYIHYRNQPLDITLRNQIGCSLQLNELYQISEKLRYLLEHSSDFESQISRIMDRYVFYLGRSGEIAGKYIISKLTNHQAKERGNIN